MGESKGSFEIPQGIYYSRERTLLFSDRSSVKDWFSGQSIKSESTTFPTAQTVRVRTYKYKWLRTRSQTMMHYTRDQWWSASSWSNCPSQAEEQQPTVDIDCSPLRPFPFPPAPCLVNQGLLLPEVRLLSEEYYNILVWRHPGRTAIQFAVSVYYEALACIPFERSESEVSCMFVRKLCSRKWTLYLWASLRAPQKPPRNLLQSPIQVSSPAFRVWSYNVWGCWREMA